jgi:hypothetical protein
MLFAACIQQTSKDSRQFENEFNLEVLTKNRENLKVNVRYWYQFHAKTGEPFDEFGKFIEEDPSIKAFTQATVFASVREVFKTYSSKELYEKEEDSLEEEIYQATKKNSNALDTNLSIQFNALLLGDIEYPHIIKNAKSANLLSEFDALKSKDSDQRLKAIQELLKEGSKESYAIVLEHWAVEKNETIREFILESLEAKN